MATYAIGDLQGCYGQLTALLASIRFEPSLDKLWFCGDLVNRGPNSLQTLRFVKELGNAAICVLGNHDLHLLAAYYGKRELGKKDTLREIIDAPDCDELLHWLTLRPLAHYDEDFDTLICHAGVYPLWERAQALALATEVEVLLANTNGVAELFSNMYGNHPKQWSNDLAGWDRVRFIINAFTRMRYTTEKGRLDFKCKDSVGSQTANLVPWFEVPKRPMAKQRILFGHWASLEGNSKHPYSIALDSGCVWGGKLTALRLEDNQYFHIDCSNCQL